MVYTPKYVCTHTRSFGVHLVEHDGFIYELKLVLSIKCIGDSSYHTLICVDETAGYDSRFWGDSPLSLSGSRKRSIRLPKKLPLRMENSRIDLSNYLEIFHQNINQQFVQHFQYIILFTLTVQYLQNNGRRLGFVSRDEPRSSSGLFIKAKCDVKRSERRNKFSS